MKKKVLKAAACVTAAALLISGCSETEPVFDPDKCDIKVTIDQLYDANKSFDNAVGIYKNCYVCVYYDGQQYPDYIMFIKDGVYFYEYLKPETRDHNADVYFNGGRWYLDYDESGSPVMKYCWYAMTDKEKAELFVKDTTDLLDSQMTEREYITDITDNEDGTAVMLTRSKKEYVNDALEKFGLSASEYSGANIDHKYVFGLSDNIVTMHRDYLTVNDKKETRYLISVQYDVNEPDFMRAVMAMAEQAYSDDSTGTKTLTVIRNSGSDSEQTYTMQYNGQYAVELVAGDGYTAYCDPGKSVLFDGIFPYDDTTVYLFSD